MEEQVIRENVSMLLETLPPEVTVVVAAKTRSPEEVRAAIQAGITCVGQNYIQEAERIVRAVDLETQWHMIGHLQRNKAKNAVRIFDMIQTLDSWRLGTAIAQACETIGKVMPVLVEINSGSEPNKTGVLPNAVDDLVWRLSELDHVRVEGLMTMGPRFGDPEAARPFFRATRKAFEHIAALNIPDVSMRILSMGMSNSYPVAIEEGATMVRIGTRVFGGRPQCQDYRKLPVPAE